MSNTKADPFVWVVHPDEVGRPATTAPRPAEVDQRPATTDEQPRPTTSAQSRAVLPSAIVFLALAKFRATHDGPGLGRKVHDLRSDLRARAELGIARYGTPLLTHNGRDAIRDLTEELLDAIMYTTQAQLEERITEDQAQEIIDALARAYQITQEAKP